MMILQVVFAKKSEKYWENCSLTCRIFETDIEMQDKMQKALCLYIIIGFY